MFSEANSSVSVEAIVEESVVFRRSSDQVLPWIYPRWGVPSIVGKRSIIQSGPLDHAVQRQKIEIRATRPISASWEESEDSDRETDAYDRSMVSLSPHHARDRGFHFSDPRLISREGGNADPLQLLPHR